MLSQDNIDSLLQDAQSAVDSLAGDVQTIAGGPEPEPVQDTDVSDSDISASTESAPAAVPQAAPVAVAPSPTPVLTPSECVERILKLRVPVVVRLAQRPMKMSILMKMTPGTILEFDRRVDRELDLLANNHQIGVGFAVKADEHFGLRITFVGDVKERIESLRGK